MNGRFDNEDPTIREVLDALEADGDLRRTDLEILGLLAYGAEPVEPRPEVKDRLMAALADSSAREPSQAGASRAGEPAVVAFGERRREAPAAGASPRKAARRGFRAGLAAAVLALAALGLAGVLWVELDRSREALARLEQEHEELVSRLAVQESLARTAGRLGDLVRVASTAGVEVCTLRPVGEKPMDPNAFGVLYMPPDDRSWYLVASDLDPSREGVYKIWIDTPEGPMPVGTIDVDAPAAGEAPGDRITITIPPGILEGRRMLSVTVTLEPSAEAESPTGPKVLYGDELMQVL